MARLGRGQPFRRPFVSGPASPDTTPPSNPSNVVISNVTRTTFDVAWTGSTDNVAVTSYSINIDGATYVATGNPGTGPVTVTARNPGQTYVVKVIARDAAGNFSGFSPSVSVTTLSGLSVMVSDGTGLVPGYLKVVDGSGSLVTPGAMMVTS